MNGVNNFEFITKCFLEQKSSLNRLNVLEFDENFIFLLKENKVLIRFFNLMKKNDIKINDRLLNEVKKEKERICELEVMIFNIATTLKKFSRDFIFIKNYQHYPDMGDDIDIYVIKNYKNIKNEIVKSLGFIELPQKLFHRIGKKIMLKHKTNNIEVELHERLGRVGEFNFNNFDILNYTQKYNSEIIIPSNELKMIIQIIQRIYTRSYLRISEILYYFEKDKRKIDVNLVASLAGILNITSGKIFYAEILDCLFKENISLNNSLFIYKSPFIKIPLTKTLPIISKRLIPLYY